MEQVKTIAAGVVNVFAPRLACLLGHHDEHSPREWDQGVMYLRCDRCGKRSSGLNPRQPAGKRRPLPKDS